MPERVTVGRVDVPDRSRFEIRSDGETAGFAAHHHRSGVIAFVHTEIDPRFEGQGLASKLIRAPLSAARSEGESVLPFCPFVRVVMATSGMTIQDALATRARRGISRAADPPSTRRRSSSSSSRVLSSWRRPAIEMASRGYG